MRRAVVFDPTAALDIDDAVAESWERGGPRLAVRFEHELTRAVEVLATMGESFLAREGGFRVYPLRRVPWSLVYRIEGDVVLVVHAVPHGVERWPMK